MPTRVGRDGIWRLLRLGGRASHADGSTHYPQANTERPVGLNDPRLRGAREVKSKCEISSNEISLAGRGRWSNHNRGHNKSASFCRDHHRRGPWCPPCVGKVGAVQCRRCVRSFSSRRDIPYGSQRSKLRPCLWVGDPADPEEPIEAIAICVR